MLKTPTHAEMTKKKKKKTPTSSELHVNSGPIAAHLSRKGGRAGAGNIYELSACINLRHPKTRTRTSSSTSESSQSSGSFAPPPPPQNSRRFVYPPLPNQKSVDVQYPRRPDQNEQRELHGAHPAPARPVEYRANKTPARQREADAKRQDSSPRVGWSGRGILRRNPVHVLDPSIPSPCRIAAMVDCHKNKIIKNSNTGTMTYEETKKRGRLQLKRRCFSLDFILLTFVCQACFPRRPFELYVYMPVNPLHFPRSEQEGLCHPGASAAHLALSSLLAVFFVLPKCYLSMLALVSSFQLQFVRVY
ncbi:hypothetical protein LX32DRAFT_192486 [Colletotrichum zoysiae]|uniref:Uncharacterized protein n=1 Tax=Colletotrichum zoysiae TaxID=1216348 RepID=A0AAD9H4S1_9PEZI|nr:hypothetical protein LX32DRAFT_192486 [Colletotrichum zoysiae]